MSEELEAIIEMQSEALATSARENLRLREDLATARSKLHSYQRGGVEDADDGGRLYWTVVYDRIRAAWDAWALAELGTSTPSPLELQGRVELADLYETIR